MDNIWLIDLRVEFKNMKSIIRIQPIKSVKSEQTSKAEGANSVTTKGEKN